MLHSAMLHPTLLLHSYPQVFLLCAVTQQLVSSSRQQIACSCMSWLSLQLQTVEVKETGGVRHAEDLPLSMPAR